MSRGIISLLLENLKTEAERNHLKRIASGKKLQYGDATVLLNSIVSAMFLENSTHEDEITELPFLCSLEPFMK